MHSMKNRLYVIVCACLLAIIVGMAAGRVTGTANRVGVITQPGGPAVTADMDGVTVFFDASATQVAFQLPLSPPNGTDVWLKRTDSNAGNTCTINTQGADQLDVYGTAFGLGIATSGTPSAMKVTYNAGVWRIMAFGN